MRTLTKLNLFIAIALSSGSQLALADTITGTGWKGTAGNNNWSSTGNWDAAAPNTGGTGDRNLFFGQGWKNAGGTGLTTANNNLSAWHGYRLTFEDIGGNSSGADDQSFSITGNSFTVYDFGGNFPKIENKSFVTQTITLTSGQILGFDGLNGGQKAELNAVNGNLTISAGTKVDLLDTTQLQIFGNNGKTLTISDVISSTGNNGTNSVAINGASIVIFGGANTYLGDTYVNNGTLRVSVNNGVNSGTFIRLGDTSGTAGANLNLDGGFSEAAKINVRSGSSGAMIIANTASTIGTATYSGNVFLDKDATLFANTGGTVVLSGSVLDLKNQTLTVDGGGTSTISGVLTNSTGNGKLVKSGSGALTISGANFYTGVTTIQTGGAIKISNSTALGGSAAGQGTTVNSGGQLQTSGTLTCAEPLTLNGTGLANDGALLITANAPTFSGAITLGSTGVRIQHAGAAGATLSGGITGSGFDLTIGLSAGMTINTSSINIGSGTLTKDGGSATILRLDTANTIGAVNLNSGSINIGNAGCFGTGTITIGSSVGTPVDNGGFNAVGSLGVLTVTNPIVLSAGAICGMGPAGSTTLELSGTISGTGALKRNRPGGTGAGVVMLSGANTFSGGLVHQSDQLILNNKQALGTGTYALGDAATAPPSAVNVSANVALSGGNAVTNPVTVNRNFTVSGSQPLEFSGAVTLAASATNTITSSGGVIFSGPITGSGFGISKAGSGSLSLNGTNTYTDVTTVSAGTLFVNGPLASSSVSVGGSTLGGNGTINGPVTILSGATLAPGVSGIGKLTLNAPPSLGGTTSMEINNSLATNDVLALSAVTLTYGGTLTVVNSGPALTGGEKFTLFTAPAYTGAFTATNLPSITAGLNWYLGNLNSEGAIYVNRPPTAQDKNIGRAKNTTLKIEKAGLLVNAADADAGDSVSYDALVSLGTQGASVTENGTTIFYSPVNNNADTLQYRLKDTRGGTVTKNINITVTNAVGVVSITNNAGGTMTVGFFGIPGFDYVIQRSPDLSAWTDISTNTAAADGEVQFTETPPYNPAFYRTRQY